MKINAVNTLAVAGGIGGFVTIWTLGLHAPMVGPLQMVTYLGGALGVIGLLWFGYDKVKKHI